MPILCYVSRYDGRRKREQRTEKPANGEERRKVLDERTSEGKDAATDEVDDGRPLASIAVASEAQEQSAERTEEKGEDGGVVNGLGRLVELDGKAGVAASSSMQGGHIAS
jgi:hypothetical protein